MRLRLARRPPTTTTRPPLRLHPTLSLVAQLRGDSVWDVQNKVIIGPLFEKKKEEQKLRREMGSPNSLCLQPNLAPINTLSGGEKHNLSIDSVEINLII